ncbi:MAG: PTS sugar transporter subunit IIC [Gemmatimonadetes bacterium]|nr:PTS sugar transporter subunit IIC [Gemmatimonadota bacterium]
MSLELLAPLVLLGALLGLDVVSFPQAMLSRPIVAATIAGVVVGQPEQGLMAGAALELIALETLPFGASRYPEWGSASVVGGALFAMQPGGRAGALSLAILGALATAWIGGGSMVALRRLNGRWARGRRDAIARGDWPAVRTLMLGGIGADLVRGGAITLVALFAMVPIMQATLGGWTVDPRTSRAASVAVLAAVAAGACWKLFRPSRTARWLFAGGLAAGLAILTLR